MKYVKNWNLFESSRNSTAIAIQLIEIMGLDNRVKFDYDSKIFFKLRTAVKRMLDAGWDASEEAIENIVAGEETEVQELYSQYDGFDEVNQVLNDIFEPPETVNLSLKYPIGYSIYQDLEVGSTFVSSKDAEQRFTVTKITNDIIYAVHDFAKLPEFKDFSFNKNTLINNFEYGLYVVL